MFWRFGYQNTTNLDTLLDNEATTLETILNEEDILQEVKTKNEKLLQFLIKPHILSSLIRYIVAQDLDESIAIKYPFLATEILCCDIEEIVQIMLEDNSYLDPLWNILDREPPLNPMHANSFAKIMNMMVTNYTMMIIPYIQARPNVVDRLLLHFDSPAIVELMLHIMTADEFHDGRDIEEWISGENIIERILDKMDPKNAESMHTTVSFALMDLVGAIHNSAETDPNLLNNHKLIVSLKSEKCIEKLVKYMVGKKEENSSSCIINGINILIELLRRGTCSDEYEIVTAPVSEVGELGNLPPPPPPIHREPLKIDEVVAVLVEYIPKFKEILLNPRKQIQPIETSNGRLLPLGAERLTLTELFAEILRVQRKDIYNQFLEHGIITACLELFFTFKWNNLLHMVICDMINTIFGGNLDETTPLIISIFQQGKLLQRILQAVKLNNYLIEQPKGVRLGYMGHITLLTDKVMQLVLEETANDAFQKLLEPFVQDDEWQEYISKGYREVKALQSRNLAGPRPHLFQNNQDDDQPFSQHVDVQTDQLARYMIQQVVQELPETFILAGQSSKHEDVNWAVFGHESTFDINANPSIDIEDDESDDDDDDNVSSTNDKASSMASEEKSAPSLKQTSVEATAKFAFPSSDDPFSDSGVSSSKSSSTTGSDWADFSKLSVNEKNKE